MPRKRIGPATLEVLQSIATGTRYGFDIIDATGLPDGTVYPALARLERDGLVTSDWEDPEIARADRRPPRRYYRLTRKGTDRLRVELEHMRRLTEALDGPTGLLADAEPEEV